MAFVKYEELTSPQAGALAKQGRVVGLIPTGAVEQHGPHLPLATDWIIAEHLGEAIAERIEETVLVTPVPPGGSSWHHIAFPGTVDLGDAVLEGFVKAYIRALVGLGVTDIAVISSHGGNFKPIGRVAQEVSADGVRVIAYDDLPAYLQVMARAAEAAGLVVPETDAHAGGLETSQMKFLRGEDKITHDPDLEGYVDADEGWLDILLNEGVHALSPIGVLGRPAGSSAAVGRAICAGLAEELSSWMAGAFDLTRREAGDVPAGSAS
jgi:creatinine amidohydrolase